MARVWQEEEAENRKWLKNDSMQCSNCGVATQKSMASDHISFRDLLEAPSQLTCPRYWTHLCYLCGQKHPADKHCQHFNVQGDRLIEGNARGRYRMDRRGFLTGFVKALLSYAGSCHSSSSTCAVSHYVDTNGSPTAPYDNHHSKRWGIEALQPQPRWIMG